MEIVYILNTKNKVKQTDEILIVQNNVYIYKLLDEI